MTTLDYASFFETHIRPRRRRRRLLLGAAAAIVWVLPVLYVGVVGG
ncbi:hypothetical protein [Phenylobacterium sp.]|nr:hypothetical protein [Phenylobacterium sp.]MBX3485067.1 hypothetical protein [Phenylobacterium sp.]MCW5758890.1 hypothetical protein [Phenylobacterium sp.]